MRFAFISNALRNAGCSSASGPFAVLNQLQSSAVAYVHRTWYSNAQHLPLGLDACSTAGVLTLPECPFVLVISAPLILLHHSLHRQLLFEAHVRHAAAIPVERTGRMHQGRSVTTILYQTMAKRWVGAPNDDPS